MRAAVLAGTVAALAACQGAVGTLQLEVVTAPDTDPLADVVRVRLTLDNPLTVVEADRESDGSFELEIDVTADGSGGRLLFEGLDAGDEVVAVGRSAVLPLAAIETTIAIYVAAPNSIAEAPVVLDPGRSEIGTALLPFGAVWAGGRDADGAPMAHMAIYNVYFHELQIGDPLPEPRAGITAVAGRFDFVYLFGGEDADGDPRSTFWRFDTGVAPGGLYAEFTSTGGIARVGREAVIIGNEQFLVAGDPAAVLDGTFGQASAVDGAPPIDGVPETLLLSDIIAEAFIAGDGTGSAGAVLYLDGQFTDLDSAPVDTLRTDHGVVELANSDALVLGGGDAGGPLASAVRYRRAERDFTVLDDFLATPRTGAAIATAGGRIVVAGGTDAAGDVVGDAEIFDADTLDPVGVHALAVPRTGASAAALANGQVVIAGGLDAAGAPVEVIELYMP